MIAQDCQHQDFIDAVKGRDRLEVIYYADREATEVERINLRARFGGGDQGMCGEEYVVFLKNLIFFVRYGIKPNGISDTDFGLLKSLVGESDEGFMI